MSKVANFSIDLPDANVAIQVSGSFGSRQEEAQRLGRILRPKSDGRGAHFYSIVTRDAEQRLLPQCRERGIAVMVNRPFADGLLLTNQAEQTEKWSMDKYKGVDIGDVIECEGGCVVVPSYSEAIIHDNDGKEITRFTGKKSRNEPGVRSM